MSLTCDDVISSDVAEQIFAPGVVAMPATLDPTLSSPLTAVPRNAGALFCSWGNMPAPGWRDPNPEFSGASLKVLPISDEDWDAYKIPTFIDNPDLEADELLTRCSPSGEGNAYASCNSEGRVNGYWVEFWGTRVGDGRSLDEVEALIQPVMGALAASLLGENALPAAWVPISPSVPLPEACESFITEAQAQELTGIAEVGVGSAWDGPHRGMTMFGMKVLDSRKCEFTLPTVDAVVGSVHAMPNGSWLAAEVAEQKILSGEALDVAVVGLDDSEVTSLSCQRDDRECILDLTVQGNWVQVTIVRPNASEIIPDKSQARDRILEIGATIVSNLTTAAAA